MTYAGLKSMLYAGVGPEDPRVVAATRWIARHYDLKSNPGLGDMGLYYYYHVFAKALDATGVERFEEADGRGHDWRAELLGELASRQQPNGSWRNSPGPGDVFGTAVASIILQIPNRYLPIFQR